MADRRRAILIALPLAIVVAVAAVAAWWLRDDGDTTREDPVALTASGPRFAELSDLVTAGDLVVVGSVVAVDDGRTITDPADPQAGVRTQLAEIRVSQVLTGEQVGPLIIEQEAALLDGRPVTVNGVAPLAVGEEGLMVLVRGNSDEFPYTAFVNEQGWIPIEDGVIALSDPADPAWREFDGEPVEAAIDAIRQATD